MMVAIDDTVRINTLSLPINELKVDFVRSPDDCKSRDEINRYTRVILPDGRRLTPSNRFWNSWCSLHNQGRSVFDLFTHAEVFDRIHSQRHDNVRLAIESYQSADIGGGELHGKLLSCTNPFKPILKFAETTQLIEKYKGQRVQYQDGVVTGTFDCPFPTPYTVAGDEYNTQFMIQMPIDGYGLPVAYLTMLRLICQNGMVGMTKAFKTSFQLGKGDGDIMSVLDRAMTTFGAEEGFHSFKLRMEAASKSWASLDEAGRLCKILSVSMKDDELPIDRRVDIIEKFDDMCGDPLKYYGLAGRQEISARRAKTIPVNATIYQLITFASEIATHELSAQNPKNAINAWTGEAIATEFDLEGTCDEFPDWKDFFVKKVG